MPSLKLRVFVIISFIISVITLLELERLNFHLMSSRTNKIVLKSAIDVLNNFNSSPKLFLMSLISLPYLDRTRVHQRECLLKEILVLKQLLCHLKKGLHIPYAF